MILKIENGNIIDIKMIGKNFIVRNVIKEYGYSG